MPEHNLVRSDITDDSLGEKPKENSFMYRGIEIKGLKHFEEKGILVRKDVTDIIDRLPQGYGKEIPLGTIEFEPYQIFSVERNGEVEYHKDDELLPTDKIIARKRGKTSWNNEMVDGVAQPTDGKITISILSTLNWDNKQDKQLDKDTTLYALAHELGHSIWTTMVYGPGVFHNLQQKGTPLPCSPTANRLLPLLKSWEALPECTLQTYLEYKDVFSKEEDFAVSYSHFLYWRDLQSLDPQRFNVQQQIFDEMS